MFAKIKSYFSLAFAYLALNFRAKLEYRGAFISQVVAMALNDCVWLIFWIVFFTRFPVLRGWNLTDVISMWTVVAAGFGLAHGICGNAITLPSLIARGKLESWMVYPRALLPHLLIGEIEVASWGDVLFGYSAFLFLAHPDLGQFLLFVFLTFSIAVLFVGFSIISGSIGFWLGNAEIVCEQWRMSMITLSTYPTTLFDGQAKLLLFTVIPAGFCNFFPVEALKHHSWLYAGFAFGGALAVLACGVCVFYLGLRRYESGNLMEMRG